MPLSISATQVNKVSWKITIIVLADACDPRVDGVADLHGHLSKHEVDEVAVLEAADELRAVQPLAVVLFGS